MAESLEGYRTSEEIRQEMAALNLELAFQTRFEEELKALKETCKTPDPELERMVQDSDERMRRQIHRKMRKGKAQHFVRTVLPRVGMTAAGLLLTFFIGLSTAIATVQSVRVSVLNFITQIEERYTSLSYEQNRAKMDVPEGWQGDYYMSYIPERFQVIDVSYNEVIYKDHDEKILGFSEYENNISCNLDTEKSNASHVTLHGREAIISEKDGWIAIAWSINNRYFVLDLMGSREEALMIAESVLEIP